MGERTSKVKTYPLAIILLYPHNMNTEIAVCTRLIIITYPLRQGSARSLYAAAAEGVRISP